MNRGRNKGTTYFIGVGPGDPELMTLKSKRLIEENELFFVRGEDPKEELAYKVAEAVVPEIKEKTIKSLEIADVIDPDRLEEICWREARNLEKYLDRGQNVAILVLGDPMVYSRSIYILYALEHDGYETVTSSGVTTFSAAAGQLKLPLAEREQPCHIIPATYSAGRYYHQAGNYVVMKTEGHMKSLRDIPGLRRRDVKAIANIGLPNQKIFENIDDIPEDSGFFTVLIAREKK
jgi:precorrin-2/cobalt-factor-2 C20-methyltransferase